MRCCNLVLGNGSSFCPGSWGIYGDCIGLKPERVMRAALEHQAHAASERVDQQQRHGHKEHRLSGFALKIALTNY